MHRPPAILAQGIEKHFGSIRAVEHASLRVEPGELVALVGPSGSGKTTLLRTIAGFETLDAGTVSIGGRAVAGPGVWEEPDRRRVGMVFQDGALFPHLTVAKNLAFGAARAERARECLAMVGLSDRSGAYPHELSGGERQRVALARALATEPDVVLLDEPFAALDEGLRASLREEVARILRAAGAGALLVTHNQEEALSLADVVAVMRDGRIAQLGPPEEVYGHPATRWVAEFLGDADVVPGTAADGVASCDLGRFPAAQTLRGAVEIVLRPEGLILLPDGDPGATRSDGSTDGSAGAHARVLGRSYFGHDQLVHLELDSGLRLRSRTSGLGAWRCGELVRVRIAGPVTVLPTGG